MTIRVDFASEGCQWEGSAFDDPCLKPGAGMAGEWFGVYCAEHLAVWHKEIKRQEERDRGKLSPEVQAWYLRMARRGTR